MRKSPIIIAGVITALIILVIVIRFKTFEYSYIPPANKIVNTGMNHLEIESLGSEKEAGTDGQIMLGKKLFFTETFGNEVFFTDIMGVFNGPLTLPNIAKAIMKLNGKGTSNLQVEAAESFKSGNITIHKGDLIDTGMDVAANSPSPVGVKVVVDRGRPRAGISCAICHAAVNSSGKVIAGAPNKDLNIGLILAMGTNTASYFSHTEIKNMKEFLRKNTSEKEQFVDQEISKWPPGSNDTTIDFNNNPVQIPDAFTLGDFPYGWSGQGQIGPFKGLSAAINNAHSQNMDTLSQVDITGPVMNIDKEEYLKVILQNSANKKFRYNPDSKEKPSSFFKTVDPTPGVAGVLRMVPSASHPKISYLSSVGFLPGSKGYKVWEQINAISAYMNSLRPPETGLKTDSAVYEEGRRIFSKAGCISCHAGEFLTNNQVVKIEDIGTEPSRAKGFKKSELYFSEPKEYASDTPIPLPKNPKITVLKLTESQKNSLKISWAHGNSNGGYKVPSLFGLYWSAPYLHDGGVAVSKEQEVGVPNTLMKGKQADPEWSLEALIDSRLRKKVIQANTASDKIKGISGAGHEYWVDDTTGFSKEQQRALIYYLLRVTD